MGLYLKMVLCDVNGDDNMCFVGGENFLKEEFVFFPKKWKPCLMRAWADFRRVFIAPA